VTHKVELIDTGGDTFDVMLEKRLIGSVVEVSVNVAIPFPHTKSGWLIKGTNQMYMDREKAVENLIERSAE